MRNSTKITENPLVGPTYTFTGYRVMKDGVEPPHKGPIDYIFVNNEFHVRNLFVFDDIENDLYPSDHFPLVADLY
jgi:endonuclease/exonuclease/phosphatase family metal-dependent hydrolase